MSTVTQIRFGGAGGQGLITAGVILAEAAMQDGRNVVQTQTYGPEARLGSSKAEVIISDGEIAYPEVMVPDILMVLSTEAATKFGKKIRPEAIVILDSTNIPPDLAIGGKVYRLPITETALRVGTKVVANTVALGVMNALTSVVTRDSLARAISARVPARFRELNERAMAAGEELAAAARAGQAQPATAGGVAG